MQHRSPAGSVLCSALAGSLGCVRGGSGRLRLSAIWCEAESGAAPGMWVDPDPSRALWHQQTMDFSQLSAENGSQEWRTNCPPVIHRRSTAKQVLAVLLLLTPLWHDVHLGRCWFPIISLDFRGNNSIPSFWVPQPSLSQKGKSHSCCSNFQCCRILGEPNGESGTSPIAGMNVQLWRIL